MEQTPDLTNYFAIHRKQVVDTRRYAAAVASAAESDRGGRLKPLARWAAGFAHELDHHHTVEDDIFFPDLRTRVASAGPVLDGLEADHVLVEGLLARWTPSARALADRRVPFGPAKDEALAVAVAVRDLLDRHLAVEDKDVLPLFWRHYTAAEYMALHERAVASQEKAGIAFTVPWFVSALDDEHVEEVRQTAPLPLKLLWYATRGRFARLERAALGGVEVDLADLRPIPA
jgi:hemerythrin-like domain-containing protein